MGIDWGVKGVSDFASEYQPPHKAHVLMATSLLEP